MPDDAPLYMDITHHPLADATIDDIADYPFPKGDDPGRFADLRERALAIRNETPYALVSGISGVVYEICWYMRGLEQWFMDMLEQPEFCEALLDRTLQFWLDWFRLFLTEVGDVVDVIMIGDDMAGQRGPLFQPEFYRRVVKPRQKQLVQYIKSRTSAKIWYHTCGGCRGYIPDLLDNGIDILNPVQISASDMAPDRPEGRVRRATDVSGAAALTPSTCCPRRSRNGTRTRPTQHRDLEAGRRLRVQQRPQHPGRCAGRQHPGHVRRGLRVRVLRFLVPPRRHRPRGGGGGEMGIDRELRGGNHLS